MKGIAGYIKQHLYLRMGLEILLILVGVFSVALGILFYQSRQLVQDAAMSKANKTLDETMLHISDIMDRTEKATADLEQLVQQNLKPDSLLAYTRRTLEEHPNILGVTIALEPDYFPEYGRYFSAYSLRTGDSIHTEVEKHEYFEQEWYKKPWEEKRSIWMEPYIDNTPGFTTSYEYNFSFVKPLYDKDDHPIGVLCTDLLLKWLSQAVTQVKPYPNSSAIMLGLDGRYIVHPDTAKLVRQTIFSDPDPKARQEVIPLGQAMLAGQRGMWKMIVDGQPAHVFYRPLERTGWSIAIVCPDSDVFRGYHSMLYTIWAIIGIALVILLLLCYLIIRRAIIPINQLANTSRQIAEGNFDESLSQDMVIRHSSRPDIIGQLQNVFNVMQQALESHVGQVRQMTKETEQKNQELQYAYHLAREANQRKTEFVQDMAHQIRTPLNIINGFTQVLSTNFTEISEEEVNDITSRMKSSSKAISHITRMLIAASEGEQKREYTTFGCNAICQEALAAMKSLAPETANINFTSNVPDDLTIRSDHKALLSILIELLDNALKFAPEGTIAMECSQNTEQNVSFAVSDTGPGISPTDKERIFTEFTKLNTFTEGIGLGLPLSQRTARLLGGDLTLDESFNPGTRFIITLPL